MAEHELALEGMRCKGCVGTIERALAKVAGVTSAKVDLEKKKATVALEGPPPWDALVQAVVDAGYQASRPATPAPRRLGLAPAPSPPPPPPPPPATHAKVAFKLPDLRCASCIATVETALKKAGVSDASVNLATKSGTATFDPMVTSVQSLVEAVRASGYTAEPIDEGDDAPITLDSDPGETRTFVVAAWLGVAVLILDHGLGVHHGPLLWLEAALATAVVAIAGAPFFRGAAAALRRLVPNMDVLVALGVTCALGWSLAALVVPSLAGGHHLSFEAAALLVVFVRGGRLLEGRAKRRGTAALEALIAREARTALKKESDGTTREVEARSIRAGDLFVVRTGETAAADARVVEGRTALDQSFLTGESIPVEVGPGDDVPGGAVNSGASIVLRATAPASASALRRVARLVADAQAQKAEVQRFADAAASVFVPAVLVVALVTLTGWLVVSQDFAVALARAVAVVVVACPCALGLATPTALLVASGVGLRRGLLVKKAPALEALARVRTVVLDKTGTLTRGTPRVVGVDAKRSSEDELLSLAAAAASQSTHPLSRAIAAHASQRKLALAPIEAHEERAGLGVAVTIGGARVLLGSRALLAAESITVSAELGERTDGATPVFVARDGQVLGAIALRDEPRPEAHDAIARLRALGLDTVVLSGDRPDAVKAIATQLGLSRAEGGLSPADKLARLEALEKATPGLVAMVGDGVNDAPALARAGVGLALGAGTDLAKEAGDVVLVRDDLRDVARAVVLGRSALANVKQNLALAVVYNVLLIPVAAGLVPGVTLGPAWAGLAMALSSVTVVGNALRLERVRLD